jgi:hypothetical protein
VCSKIISLAFKNPVVVETGERDGPVSVKVGGKEIFRVGAAPALPPARAAAEAYLKSHHPKASITSDEMANRDHAVFYGVVTSDDEEEHPFRLHMIRKKGKWEFERLDQVEGQE